jgi:hypothetical protein
MALCEDGRRKGSDSESSNEATRAQNEHDKEPWVKFFGRRVRRLFQVVGWRGTGRASQRGRPVKEGGAEREKLPAKKRRGTSSLKEVYIGMHNTLRVG